MKFRITVLLLVLLWLIAAWRLAELPRIMQGVPRSAQLEDALLFQAALAEKLLRPLPDGRLQPVPEDILLWERVRAIQADDSTASPDEKRERLLWTLYHSAAGRAVLGQVQLWNRSRRLAAVRDSSSALEGVYSTGWRVYECDEEILAAGSLVPELFGYIHQGHLKTGFGEWVTGSGSGDGGDTDCLEFRTRFSAVEPKPIAVQFIGRSQNQRAVEMIRPPSRLQRQRSCLSVETLCEVGQEKAGRFVLDTQGWVPGGELNNTAMWQRQVRLRLTPVSHPETRVAGLNIRLTEDCQYAWQTGFNDRLPMVTQTYTVQSRDGVPLLDREGRPTSQTAELGLLPLVGFGRSDYDSISGLLARSFAPQNYRVDLTIDSRVQTAAQQALHTGLQKFFPAKSDPYDKERRAALVVLDADSGAIRAVAGYPEPPVPGTVTDWDLAAFARVYPVDDPLKVRAWQGVSRLYAPGSIFKTITALAALAAPQNEVQVLVQGLPPSPFTALTGLTLNDYRYRPYAGTELSDFADWQIANFANQTLNRVLYRHDSRGRRVGYEPLRAEVCVGGTTPVGDTLGLVSALRDSVNIWFARLAMLLDGEAALAYDRNYWQVSDEHPVPDLQLTAMMKQWGIGQTGSLVNKAPPFIVRPGLISEGGHADLLSGGYPLAWTLVQNAIGQGVQVTPLTMASVAAAIASGRRVFPHLIERWGERPAGYLPGETLTMDLDRLRAGMKAVTEVGTAQSAFEDSPDRCVVWGKTGTAEIGQSDGTGLEPFKTVWFIGWHAATDKPKRAFACMVSHGHGQYDTGGEVCAPIIADFFRRLGDRQTTENQAP